MAQRIAEQFPGAILINDDGKNEIADLILIRRLGERAVVRLYHCKYQSGKGANLDDLHELLGQVQRSARWASDPRSFWKEAAIRIGGRFKIKAGDETAARAYLAECAEKPPLTEFILTAVQPGIHASRMKPGDNVNVVLTMTDNVVRAHNATFNVVIADPVTKSVQQRDDTRPLRELVTVHAQRTSRRSPSPN